jgi:hypothetical protein
MFGSKENKRNGPNYTSAELGLKTILKEIKLVKIKITYLEW